MKSEHEDYLENRVIAPGTADVTSPTDFKVRYSQQVSTTQPDTQITTGQMFVTPTKTLDQMPEQMDIDGKIDFFEDKLLGWQLRIADQLAKSDTIKGAGFAVLAIVVNYFELIAKMSAGYDQTGETSKYFKDGLRRVFLQYNDDKYSEYIDIVYKYIRNSLYHRGVSGSNRKTLPLFILTIEATTPIELDLQAQMIRVSSDSLPEALIEDFERRIAELRNISNTKARADFEKWFDALE